MLPPRMASVLNQAANANATDAEIEVAALELLTPSTHQVYRSRVQLLSERAAAPPQPAPPADAADFELMARALIDAPETDPLQFILAGLTLDLAGELTPRMRRGAAILLAASRRDDFSETLRGDVVELLDDAAPIGAFREAAITSAGESGDPGAYANASAAFASVVDDERAGRVRYLLDHIGIMDEATSPHTAATLLTHAFALEDLPRLSLIARAAGDRAAAASKRLPRDGRLLDAARGQLHFTQELVIALAVAAVALLGLLSIVGLKLIQGLRSLLRSGSDRGDDHNDDLIDLSSNRSWRPL
jgi:hypothetical protein